MPDWPAPPWPTAEAALNDIKSEDLEARLAAIASLAGATDDLRGPAQEALTAALDDPSPKVRAEAALALAELGPEPALDRLVELVDDPAGRVAQAAVIALGESGDPSVEPRLLEAMEAEDSDVRFQAVLALARVAGHDAIEPLGRAATDVDAEVRANAAAALADLTGDGGDELSPVLVQLLRDEAHAVRLEAALALGAQGDKRALPVLIDALSDSESAPQAVRVLGLLGDPEAAAPLRALCRRWTARAPLRAAAAAALTAVGDATGPAELDKWLLARRREPRAMAIHAAGELRLRPAVKRLCAMLGQPKLPDRDAVARSLGQIGDPAARRALESATTDLDPDVVVEAQLALRALDK